jgi:hypothetical protein
MHLLIRKKVHYFFQLRHQTLTSNPTPPQMRRRRICPVSILVSSLNLKASWEKEEK